ncbi:MAG: hypothetical protein ACOH2H_07755 [Cypionkella sp.]
MAGGSAWGGAGLLTLYERGHSADARARAALLADAAIGGDAPVEDLTLGDLDRAIWSLRTQVMGSGGEATSTCLACGTRMEFQLPDGFAPPPPVSTVAQVDWRGQTYALRLPRLSDLGRHGLGPQHLNPSAPWDDAGFADAAEQALEAADPALHIQIALSCPECGGDAVQDFDPAAFFWAEVEDMARRLVSDVARLARLYGWSEAEITAMSPRRRALYLAEAAR